jgi:hypothetical protein
MKANCDCWRWPLRWAISFVNLFLMGLVIFADTARVDRAQKGSRKSEVNMIDELANRNKPPNLVRARQRDEVPVATWIPVFPNDYDWHEQDRVVKAIDNLREHMTADLWEQMVQTTNDRRYLLTVENRLESAQNWSVSTLCQRLAKVSLLGVVRRHWPRKGGRMIGLKIGITNLPKWRKERANKSLYELQIEICEHGLAQLRRAKSISKEQKDATRTKIEAHLEMLKKTKGPIFVDGIPFTISGLYDAERAAHIRAELKATENKRQKKREKKRAHSEKRTQLV